MLYIALQRKCRNEIFLLFKKVVQMPLILKYLMHNNGVGTNVQKPLEPLLVLCPLNDNLSFRIIVTMVIRLLCI